MIYFEQAFMLPLFDMGTHQARLIVKGYGVGDGYAVEQVLELDGHMRKTIDLKTLTRDQLLDVYEFAHHQLHGRDPRGLDPREGPTRLHPGPGR